MPLAFEMSYMYKVDKRLYNHWTRMLVQPCHVFANKLSNLFLNGGHVILINNVVSITPAGVL